MHVLITGATGFVGRAVAARFLRGGWRVTALSRDAASARRRLPPGVEVVEWNPGASGAAASTRLPSADSVVHLAGASIVGGLWTKARKRRLWTSRVDATRALVAALSRLEKPPSSFVGVSGMGYHGDAGAREARAEDGAGDDFLGRLAVAWEQAAAGAGGFGARVVHVRPGMILGKGGGALPPLALSTRLGLGAVLGTGAQYWPWIHLEDVAELFFQAAQDLQAGGAWRGPVHAVAGEPVTQREFAAELARVLRRPLWLRVPAPLLRLAMGEMADVFLHGQRAREEGRIAFRYPTLEAALRQALDP
jgi:uncharacterized protein (TIGR01777 family)